MRRGTTPTVTLTVTNEDGTPCDLTGAELFVTFQEQGCAGRELTKTDVDAVVDGDATVITLTLSQEDTLAFREGYKVRVQVRAKKDGKALASTIASFGADEILMDGEI